MPHTVRFPPGLEMDKKDWDALTEPGAKAIAAMQKQITSLRGRVNSNPSATQLDFGGKDGGISDEMEVLVNRAKAVDESLSKLQTTLGSISYSKEFQKGIRDSYTAMDEFVGQGELGVKAYESLSHSLQGFINIAGSAKLSNITRKIAGQQVNLTTAITEQAAALNQVGLGYRQFAQNVDMAIYSFGLNAKQVQDFNFQIKQMADTLKMAPGDISSNFNRLAKSMAYDLETIRGQFLRFQKLSLQTGVGFDTLTSKFGANMDTISGASSAAANINMLLGRNVFSATQILTMPDAERAEAMRNAIMSDPSIMADIERGGTTGKFALQTVASQMNMSVDEARRFITTGEKPDEKTGKEGSVKSEIGKELNNALGPAKLKELGNGIDALGKTINLVREEILNQATPTQKSQILARGARLRALREKQDDTSIFGNMAMNIDLGVMPGNLQNEDLAAAMFQGVSTDRNLQRLVKNLQRGTIVEADLLRSFNMMGEGNNAKSLKDLFNALMGADAKARDQAEQAILTAVQAGDDPKNAFNKVMNDMGVGARAGYSLLYETSEYGARVLARRLIQMHNSNNKKGIAAASEELNRYAETGFKKTDTGQLFRDPKFKFDAEIIDAKKFFTQGAKEFELLFKGSGSTDPKEPTGKFTATTQEAREFEQAAGFRQNTAAPAANSGQGVTLSASGMQDRGRLSGQNMIPPPREEVVVQQKEIQSLTLIINGAEIKATKGSVKIETKSTFQKLLEGSKK